MCIKRSRLVVSAVFGSVFMSAHIYKITRDTNGLVNTTIRASTKSCVSEEQVALGAAESV